MVERTESTDERPVSGFSGPSREERVWGMGAVLSSLVGYIFPIIGVFASILAPLVIFFLKRDESKFVAFHALQTVYFQAAVLLIYAFSFLTLPTCMRLLGISLVIIGFVGSFVYTIYIALRAYSGEWAEFLLLGQLARNTMSWF